MERNHRFEIFIDCLWGLASLAVSYLVAFSVFATTGLEALLGTPSLWLHAALFATFVYFFSLRLRRHFVWSEQRTSLKPPRHGSTFAR